MFNKIIDVFMKKDIDSRRKILVEWDPKLIEEFIYFDVNEGSIFTPMKLNQLVKNIFIQDGYSVKITEGESDKGIDLIAEKGEARIGIQLKKYALSGTSFVDNAVIEKAEYGKVHYNLTHIIIINTNSAFTDGAVKMASERNIELMTRKELYLLIARVYPEFFALAMYKLHTRPLLKCKKCLGNMVLQYNKKYRSYYFRCDNLECRETVNYPKGSDINSYKSEMKRRIDSLSNY